MVNIERFDIAKLRYEVVNRHGDKVNINIEDGRQGIELNYKILFSRQKEKNSPT